MPCGEIAMYFTPKTIATQHDVSLATVYRWLRFHGLESYKVGQRYRITPAALDAFLERCQQSATVPQVEAGETAKGNEVGA